VLGHLELIEGSHSSIAAANVRCACCLLLLATYAAGIPAFAQATQKPFSISITAANSTVKAGSDVWVTVRLVNTSNHDLDESGSISNMTGIDPNLLFTVWDANGKLARKLTYPHEFESGSPVNRTIKPGESISEDQRVSRLYDMSRPGKYVIQVLRTASDNPRGGFVKSNTLTITVTP
jgi:hypothetical protein